MRLALAAAVLLALVVGLYYLLFARHPAPGTDGVGVAPATRVESAAVPADAPELAPAVPSARAVEPAIATTDSVPSTTSIRSSLTIDVAGEDGGSLVRVVVECRDGLARNVPLVEIFERTRRASELAAGEYTVSATANGFLTAFRRVVLGQPPRDERIDVVLERAPVVRVRWQVDDGRPILDALQTAGILKSPVFLRVATDDVLRSLGDRAPNSRQSFVFIEWPSTSTQLSARPVPWPAAPPDAVCELTLASALPAVVCASIDGTILESVRVEDASKEIVFRTPLEFLRTVSTSVHFCLVDDETGEPLVGAEFMATAGGGVGRSPIRVGPTGCREDPGFSPGKWLLQFSASGFAPLWREVEFVGRDALDLGVLRMLAPAAVHVRVSYADGNSAAGVTLSLLPVESAAWGKGTILSTDAEGRAQFTDLSRDPYLLAVADARFASRCLKVQPEAGDRHRPIELRVELGVEIALDFGPRTATGARAFVSDHDGHLVSVVSLPAAGCAPMRLVPGKYVVELEGSDSARAITVTDESVVYDLR
jgi:hypothetical protein